MKNFLKNNWFKIIILVIAGGYVLILFFNFLLEGKKYNLVIYKDRVKWCFDLTQGRDPALSVCQKAIDRYYFNNNFFVNNQSQKLYERERAFWSCYSNEWNKNHNSEESSKYCSQEADKMLK